MPDTKYFHDLKLQAEYKCAAGPKYRWDKSYYCTKEGYVPPHMIEKLIIQNLADCPYECWDSLYHRLCRAERKYERHLHVQSEPTPVVNDYLDMFRHLEIFKRMLALGMFGESGIKYIPTIILELPLVKVMLICVNPDLEKYLKLSPEYDYCFMALV